MTETVRKRLERLLVGLIVFIVIALFVLIGVPRLSKRMIFQNEWLTVSSAIVSGGVRSVEGTYTAIAKEPYSPEVLKNIEALPKYTEFFWDNGGYGFREGGVPALFTDDLSKIEAVLQTELLKGDALTPVYSYETGDDNIRTAYALVFRTHLDDETGALSEEPPDATVLTHRGKWNGIYIATAAQLIRTEGDVWLFPFETLYKVAWMPENDLSNQHDPSHETYRTKHGYTAELFYEPGTPTDAFLYEDGIFYDIAIGTDDLATAKAYLDTVE